MVDIILYSVITIHLPPLPLSTYRNALPPTRPLTFLKTETYLGTVHTPHLPI